MAEAQNEGSVQGTSVRCGPQEVCRRYQC